MRPILTTICLLLLWLNTSAQATFSHEYFVSSRNDTLLYRQLTPEHPQTGEKYPLVLFLHGAGERGTDNEKQLMHGAQMWLNPLNREQYPAFVLIPQCPPDAYWAYTERPTSFQPADMPDDPPLSPIFNTLKEMLDTWMNKPEVDKRRIYIIGLSMGAMGTYDLTIRYPEIFAAAVPICGTVNPSRFSEAQKQVKFRIFHGDADDVVTVEGSRAAYRALKKLGADIYYTEFPGCAHASWHPAFNQPDFMSWLFSQHKQVPANPDTLSDKQ